MMPRTACQKAIDLFAYMSRSLGWCSRAKSTQGVSGAFGKFGRFSSDSGERTERIAARGRSRCSQYARAEQSKLHARHHPPRFRYSRRPARRISWNAIRLRGYRPLMSASYVPNSTTVQSTFHAAGSYKLVSVQGRRCQRNAHKAGCLVSYLNRQLPRVDILGQSASRQPSARRCSVRRSLARRGWQALGFLGVGAGYGRDTYNSNATITVTVAPRSSTSVGLAGQ